MIKKHISKKILTIGPDYKEHRGGIGGVIQVYQSFFECFNFVASYKYYNNNLSKSGFFLKQLIVITWELLRNKKIEIVHIHGSHGGSFYRKFFIYLIAKIIFQKKVIYHIHSGTFDFFYKKSSGLQKKMISQFVNGADAVVCLSKVWEEFINKNFQCKKTCIINNVVAPPDLKNILPEKNFKDRTINFLFLGRIGDGKGIFDVTNMLSMKKESFQGKMKLYIGGDGEIDKLSAIIKETGLNEIVEYVGWVNSDKKNNMLLNSDVYILPSYGEGLPVSVLEAMSYGLPVISTPVGGIPEIVEDSKNGILVRPGDQAALESAFNFFLSNPAKIKEYGANSLVKITSYFPDYVSLQLEKLYRSL